MKATVFCSVGQSCLTLSDSMDCSPPGFSVLGILQARILEWVAIPPPGDHPNPGVKPRSPTLKADSLPAEPPGKPKNLPGPRKTRMLVSLDAEDQGCQECIHNSLFVCSYYFAIMKNKS